MMAATEIKEFLAWRGAVSFGHVCIMNAAQWPPCLFNWESLAFYIFPEYRMVFMSKDIKQGGTFKILLLFYLIHWNEQKPSGFSSLEFLTEAFSLTASWKHDLYMYPLFPFKIQITWKKNLKELLLKFVPDFFLVC